MNNIIEYPHIQAMLSMPHKVLSESAEHIALYSPISNVVALECKNTDFRIDDILSNANDALIQTTNRSVFNSFRNQYPISTELVQFVFLKGEQNTQNFYRLRKNDLSKVIETYADHFYVSQSYVENLFKRDRIYGYYQDEILIGYSVRHIDLSIGGLFIFPKFRGKGFGKKLLQAQISEIIDNVRYSQVFPYNEISMKLHYSVGAKRCKQHIFWMYTHGFEYPKSII